MPSWNRVTNQRTATAATKVFPEAWHAFTATRDRLATACRMSSWSGQRSWRRRPRQNRTGSRTTPARAVASSAGGGALRIRHHCLDERERQQRLPVLPGQLDALGGLPEAAVGEPGGGFEPVAQLHPFDLAAEHAHDEGDQVVAVARLLANGADDAFGTAPGVAGLPLGEGAAKSTAPGCSRAVLSQQHGWETSRISTGFPGALDRSSLREHPDGAREPDHVRRIRFVDGNKPRSRSEERRVGNEWRCRWAQNE